MSKFEESKEKDACKNCRYFLEFTALESHSGGAQGRCRRYPPQTTALIGNGQILFAHDVPAVKKNDWCGEFAREGKISVLQ